MASTLKPIHTPQVHSHHAGPAAPMSHSTSSKSGAPMSRPSTTDLARSCSHSIGVVLLKPKAFSITKVPYKLKGMSITALMAMNDAISAACDTSPGPHCCATNSFKAFRPPSSVQPSTTATPQASSSMPKRVLATV